MIITSWCCWIITADAVAFVAFVAAAAATALAAPAVVVVAVVVAAAAEEEEEEAEVISGMPTSETRNTTRKRRSAIWIRLCFKEISSPGHFNRKWPKIAF